MTSFYLIRSEFIILENNLLSFPIPLMLQVPYNLFIQASTNSTAMTHYIREMHPYLVQTSVGPKESISDGLQPCITYNPPGPYHPGLSPDRNVSTYILNITFGKIRPGH